MTREEERLAELGVAGKHYGRDPNLSTLELLTAAALAYARPIVAEECAVIVNKKANAMYSRGGSVWEEFQALVDAIREHGKEKPKDNVDIEQGDKIND